MIEGKRRRVQQSVSLQPDHERAVRLMATEDGHETVSRVFQEMIEREMVGRLGRDWRRRLRAEEVAAADVA